MNCHATRAVLDLRAEGRLTPRRDAAVAAHLASCEACRTMAAPVPAFAPTPVPAAGAALKARLSATLKSPKAHAPEPDAAHALPLWPREFAGVAVAAAALVLIALGIGWSGAPSQLYDDGDSLAAGRTP